MRRLFAAVIEDERVAAFEADDFFTILCGKDHQLLNEALRRRGAAAALADLYDAGTRCGVSEDVRVDQVVDQKHRRALDRVDGLDREQFGVARASADQRDAATG